jgi:RNA polymerase sigma-54 factor
MENASHITPDFEVRSEGNTLLLTVRNDIPELQISESYQMEYDRLSTKKNKRETDDETLIRSQYENAGNFIMLLKMRQEKLYNIMKAIMFKQQDFFVSGDPMTLKPMVLNDIAEATGYDVSTISRARNNKYVDTNWGIFDLKYFFSKGIDENETSSIAIKETIKELVEKEDKHKPLSDEQLCKALQERGFPIKRRTVAKYRDNLMIPVARQRKEL